VSPAAEQTGDADVRAHDEAGFEADGSGCALSSVVQLRSERSFQAVPKRGEQTDAVRRSRSGVGVISDRR